MRILILNFILSTAVDGKIIRRPSNRDTMIYNLARGFCRLGHKVTLAAAEEFRPLEDETNDFEVIYFPSRLPKIFKPALLPWPKGLGKYLRKHSADFDMILSVEAFSIPTLIASFHCKDKLIIWQEMAFKQHLMHGIPATLWYNIVVRLFLRHVPILCQSTSAKQFISQYSHCVADTIVGHGVDDEVFHCEGKASCDFVIVSMFVARKRIDRIIEKFFRFINNTKHKDYLLHIVGEGPELETLKRKAEELGVSTNVVFHGFKTHHQFAEIERDSVAMLIDTRQDNNMVSIPEAVVNGVPILTNSVPTNSSMIREYNLGIVKDDWDWQEMEQMIQRYNEFHANCCKHSESFSNTGVAKRLINAFNNITEK